MMLQRKMSSDSYFMAAQGIARPNLANVSLLQNNLDISPAASLYFLGAARQVNLPACHKMR
jgi:hypothetical protein